MAQLFSLGIIHAFMKYTLPLITFLALTVSSMAMDDATISQKIVGTWQMTSVPSILLTVQSDGTFTQTNTMSHSTDSGTWQIRSQSFVMKPKGKPEESLKIFGISDRAFGGQHGTNTSDQVIYLKHDA